MRALFVTDLDGTLLDEQGRIGERSLRALEALGRAGSVRAVATGRSLHSTLQVLSPDAPIDYLVFSSGAGVVRFERDHIEETLLSHSLDEEQAKGATQVCLDRGMNVMLHAPVPDSHRFAYLQQHSDNDGLARRVERYRQHCYELSLDAKGRLQWQGPASQVLALPTAGDAAGQWAALAARLPDLHVVRTTSPVDGHSLWLEVFPAHVSKAHATRWLAEREGIAHGCVFAVGNDYNDLDLLEWACQSAVVGNAPAELRARYPSVADHRNSGVADAIHYFRLLA